ncbi:hypothetical protein [Kitasatospora sp. NPDC097643]|uniref:hypothetical protein n=1 Tax=Kitasatospora sp. NPDC097643 TaxID=3157230 RepID=UPI003316C0DF
MNYWNKGRDWATFVRLWVLVVGLPWLYTVFVGPVLDPQGLAVLTLCGLIFLLGGGAALMVWIPVVVAVWGPKEMKK